MTGSSPQERSGTRRGRVAGAGADGWCLYAAGYKRAAELLIEHVQSTYEVNTVVFPIVFLYRHYLEITLKEIIGYGRYLDGNPPTPPGGHGLEHLWTEAKALIRKHLGDVPSSTLDRLDALTRQLADLDPSSEASRYPMTKERVASYPWSAAPIDLDHLARHMTEAAGLIEPIVRTLSVYQDLEAESRSDYYRHL